MRIPLILSALLLAAGCGGAPRYEQLVMPPPSNPGDAAPEASPQDESIVAFINDQPVTWRSVVDHAMASRGKELIDQYILWKLRQERIQELGIRNTPDELKRRAKVGLEAKRTMVGPEQMKKWLEAQQLTEEQVIDRLARNPDFDEIVKNEKAATYTLITEASVEIDTVAFTDNQEAASFAALAVRQPFGEAVERLQAAPGVQGKVAYWPRYRFCRGLAPDAIAVTPELEKKLFTMKKGGTTGVESTTKGILVVIHIVETYAADPAPYAAVADKVLKEVLRQPPSEDQIRLWMEWVFKSKGIRYEARYTPRNQGR